MVELEEASLDLDVWHRCPRGLPALRRSVKGSFAPLEGVHGRFAENKLDANISVLQALALYVLQEVG